METLYDRVVELILDCLSHDLDLLLFEILLVAFAEVEVLDGLCSEAHPVLDHTTQVESINIEVLI